MGGGCCSLYMNIHGVEKKLLLVVLPRGCATICSEHVKKTICIYCTDFTNGPLTVASRSLANKTQYAVSICSALPAVLPFA